MVNILKSSFWNLFGTAVIILSGAVLTFVAPKILSITDFGLWRKFILYSTYAGILHFGIADGYLLNNVTLQKVDAFKNLKRSIPFLLIQQVIVSAIVLLSLVIFMKDNDHIFIGACVLVFSITINIRTLLDNYLMINKDFKSSNIVKILDKIVFLVLLFGLFIIDKIGYQEIIFLFIISSFIALLLIVFMVNPKFEFPKGIIKKNMVDIRMGSQLLFSNIFIILLFNIDSIIVSMLLGIKSFAVFSFAITIIMLINQFAESISQVFFPYLATNRREMLFEVNKLIASSLFGIWLLILQVSFLFVPLIKVFFPDYADSEIIIVVYLLTSLFTLLIRISQNNMYKILNAQKEFIKIEVAVLLLILAMAYLAQDHMSTLIISIVIMLTRVIWYLSNEIRLKENIKLAFLVIIGFIIYAGIYITMYYYLNQIILKTILFFIASLPIYYIVGIKIVRNKKLSRAIE